MSIDAAALETHPAASNPMGFKGAGEGGLVAVAAAIANAIAHALKDQEVMPSVTP